MENEKRKYYVYFHRRKDDGTVFYVGKGTGFRCKSKHGRGVSWREYVKDLDYSIEIVAKDLTEEEALNLESDLINSDRFPNLLNKIKQSSSVKFDIDRLRKLFKYDTGSVTCLSRIQRSFNGIGDVGKIGDAGHLTSRFGKDYYKVKFQNKSCLVHRIIWTLFHGQIPDGMVIDHIDGNSLNNRIENLRCVTKAINAKNRLKKMKGVSENLPVGIFLDEAGLRYRTRVSGKMLSFSIKTLGQEEALRLAILSRQSHNTQEHQ